jgi:hypothetical protein
MVVLDGCGCRIPLLAAVLAKRTGLSSRNEPARGHGGSPSRRDATTTGSHHPAGGTDGWGFWLRTLSGERVSIPPPSVGFGEDQLLMGSPTIASQVVRVCAALSLAWKGAELPRRPVNRP